MGKGDRRSKRGKIWRGTHGKKRSKKKEKERALRAAGRTTAAPTRPRSK